MNLSSFSIFISIASKFAVIPIELSFMPMLSGSHTVKMLMKEQRSFHMELVYQMSVALTVSKGDVCGLILWKLPTDLIKNMQYS